MNTLLRNDIGEYAILNDISPNEQMIAEPT
jgi:hypothetical protein